MAPPLRVGNQAGLDHEDEVPVIVFTDGDDEQIFLKNIEIFGPTGDLAVMPLGIRHVGFLRSDPVSSHVCFHCLGPVTSVP